MLYSFRIDQPGLTGAAFLVERPALDSSGDLESGFFAHAGQIERHPSPSSISGTANLATRLAALPGIETVILIRNPNLVLDEGLPGRIAAALARLAPLCGRWSLAAAGGQTPGGIGVSALYSSASPHLPLHPSPLPLADALPDLVLVDATWLGALAARGRALPDAALEPVLITEGWLEGRAALYAPELVAGIAGPLSFRDPLSLRIELQRWFAERLPGERIATLSGGIAITPPAGPGNATAQTLAEAVDRVIAGLCDPLSLSIVTRTRFDRPHLLERLLASVTRARREGAEIEVVLSSDAPRESCEAALDALRARFVNLTLRLCHNTGGGHSRVANLIGGLRAARGEYVAVMDDDDYVDVFAFAEMEKALFLGARPLMITGSIVHAEEWSETRPGRHVLTGQSEKSTYPAQGWRHMFGGVNRLPVCALVMPRDRLFARLEAFEFRHDLSEDYALHLLVLTDPALPGIAELPGTFGHISLRPGESHSMTLADRRPWARDIALYLADLTRSGAVVSATWALLGGADSADHALQAKSVAELEAALTARDRQLKLMRLEIDRLRATAPAPHYVPKAASTEVPREASREAGKAGFGDPSSVRPDDAHNEAAA